jgi:hypothetical protein
MLFVIVAALAFSMLGCGGITPPPTPAAGLYVGTAQIQGVENTFQAIILPDGSLFASYNSDTQGFGTVVSGPMTVTDGNSSSTYASSVGIFTAGDLYPATGTFFATEQGLELEGTVSIPSENVTWTFGADVPAATAYTYNEPAQLSEIVGTWQAGDWTPGYNNGDNIARFGLQIDTSGAFSNTPQSPQSCNYNGSLTPDPSHNFYNVSVTYSGSCSAQTFTGTGVVTNSASPAGAKQLQVVLYYGEGFIVDYVPPAP